MKKIISDMSGAEEGDRVFAWQGGNTRDDKTNGKVEVASTLSLMVVFDSPDYETEWYEKTTGILEASSPFKASHSAPSLYWSQPEIIAPERPRRLVERMVKMEKQISNSTIHIHYGLHEPSCVIAEQELTIMVEED